MGYAYGITEKEKSLKKKGYSHWVGGLNHDEAKDKAKSMRSHGFNATVKYDSTMVKGYGSWSVWAKAKDLKEMVE